MSKFLDYVHSLIKAHVPYIWLTTHEEERLIQELSVGIGGNTDKYETFIWSVCRGVCTPKEMHESGPTQADGFADSKAPNAAIDKMLSYSSKKNCILIMRDFHTVLTQPVPRLLRDYYTQMIKNKKTLIFVSPMVAHGQGGSKPGIEPTLEKLVTVTEYDLPKAPDIKQRIIHTISKGKAFKVKAEKTGKKIKTILDYTDEEIDAFVRALQGLTQVEIDNSINTSLVHNKKLDIDFLLQQKKQIIKRSDILEYIDVRPGFEEVGGCDQFKDFVALYSDQFSPEAKEFGVDPLRGIILTGVPGCAKSLSAKALAAYWKLPLLRLDVGKVMTGLVGGSEAKMREVISVVESSAPAVLWIDEIEKSLSGTKSSNMSDGGTMSRVFGTLLTAMEERLEGVIIIATANDISALPPELLRRFNEIFFVGLPTDNERKEILDIHLKKRGRDPKKLNLAVAKIMKATKNYTGSEIEKAVKESIVRAFRDGKRNINTADLLSAIADTKPISRIMSDKIEELNDWAKGKARYASSELEAIHNPPKKKAKGKVSSADELLDGDDDIDLLATDDETVRDLEVE